MIRGAGCAAPWPAPAWTVPAWTVPARTRPAGKQAGYRSVPKAGPGMDGPAASPTTPAWPAPARPSLVPGPYDTCPLDEPRADATQDPYDTCGQVLYVTCSLR